MYTLLTHNRTKNNSLIIVRLNIVLELLREIDYISFIIMNEWWEGETSNLN
jgi:hypothetical protein